MEQWQIGVFGFAVIGVAVVISFLMRSKHDLWVLPLAPVPVAASILFARQFDTGRSALEVAALFGCLFSMSGILRGLLGSDDRHDTSLYRTKPWHLLVIGALLVAAAAAFAFLRVADPLDLDPVSGAVARRPDLLLSMALGCCAWRCLWSDSTPAAPGLACCGPCRCCHLAV